jgi:hypothetical protein
MACEHRGCKCGGETVTRGGKKFCGERCAELETGGKHEKSCPCGHPNCGTPEK